MDVNAMNPATASQGLLQQQQSTTTNHNNTNSNNSCNIEEQRHHSTDDGDDNEPFFWHFADWDNVLPQSRDGSPHATDEVFNSVSHLAAFIISVLGTVLLITKSATSDSGVAWKVVSFSIYGLSLCNLFLCSTLHHAVTSTRKVERLFQLLDYLAIFPLIAGTFTPMCLVFLHSTVIGWSFLAVVWTLSMISMVGLSHHFVKTPKWLTMTLYITLGWFGGFLALYLYPTYLQLNGIMLLILGGAFYTVGGYIYTTEQPSSDRLIPGKFGFHELWHIFVSKYGHDCNVVLSISSILDFFLTISFWYL
jgi:hemolysin III